MNGVEFASYCLLTAGCAETTKAMLAGLRARHRATGAFLRHTGRLPREKGGRQDIERVVTVLFADIRGFTTRCESLAPVDAVRLLNLYHEHMTGVVEAHGGIVNQLVGDGIMAIFGATGQSRHADEAIAAGRAMLDSLDELGERLEAHGFDPVRIGVGVNTGPAIVGTIGSSRRMEYTAIGDTVNTAARLESATKQYGVDLLISDALRARLGPDFVCRTADLVKVKGKTEPVAVFTLIGKADTAPPPRGLAEFEAAIQLYRSGDFTAAITHLEQAAAAGLDDPLTFLYLHRCRDLIENPPDTWDGTYTLKSK